MIILLLILLFLWHLIPFLEKYSDYRYIAIEESSLLAEIADKYTPDYNSNIIRQVSMLMAVTFKKGRCGYERDGSFSTKKGDPMADVDVGGCMPEFLSCGMGSRSGHRDHGHI